MILGIFFVLLGISLLLRVLFGWHIPVFRTLVALFLIYLGIRMLVGGWGWGRHWTGWKDESWRGFSTKDSSSVLFDRGDFRYEKDSRRSHYSTVFGGSAIDLTNLGGADLARIHIDTVFGDTRVLVDTSKPLVIHATSVFGEARMPNDDMVAFGTLNYRSPGTSGDHAARVYATAVFGSIKFVTAGASGEPKAQPSSSPGNSDDEDDSDDE